MLHFQSLSLHVSQSESPIRELSAQAPFPELPERERERGGRERERETLRFQSLLYLSLKIPGK
jgi:hypothetical protein